HRRPRRSPPRLPPSDEGPVPTAPGRPPVGRHANSARREPGTLTGAGRGPGPGAASGRSPPRRRASGTRPWRVGAYVVETDGSSPCRSRNEARVPGGAAYAGGMAPNIATNTRVSLDELLDFVRPRHRAILLTRRADGSPQGSPLTCGVDDSGRVV